VQLEYIVILADASALPSGFLEGTYEGEMSWREGSELHTM
jgi:hypothetical protein